MVVKFRAFFIFLAGFIFGLILLIVLISLYSRKDMLVNYESGSIRIKYVVGPFEIFDELLPTNAYEAVGTILTKQETPSESWHLAYSQKITPWGVTNYDYASGLVVSDIGRLGSVLTAVPNEEAEEIKNGYRRVLLKEGPRRASEYTDKVLDEYYESQLN